MSAGALGGHCFHCFQFFWRKRKSDPEERKPLLTTLMGPMFGHFWIQVNYFEPCVPFFKYVGPMFNLVLAEWAEYPRPCTLLGPQQPHKPGPGPSACVQRGGFWLAAMTFRFFQNLNVLSLYLLLPPKTLPIPAPSCNVANPTPNFNPRATGCSWQTLRRKQFFDYSFGLGPPRGKTRTACTEEDEQRGKVNQGKNQTQGGEGGLCN